MVSAAFCSTPPLQFALCSVHSGWESSIIRSAGKRLVWAWGRVKERNLGGSHAHLTPMCVGKPGPACESALTLSESTCCLVPGTSCHPRE